MVSSTAKQKRPGRPVAVLGGNPVTRRVLEIATHGRVKDGANGGILLDAEAAGVRDTALWLAPGASHTMGQTISVQESSP